MAYLSKPLQKPTSIFPKDSDNSFKASRFVETVPGESIRLSRALAIIHAFECLIRQGRFDVIHGLRQVAAEEPIDRDICEALTDPIVDAMCKGGGVSNRSTRLLDSAHGLIENLIPAEGFQQGDRLVLSKYIDAFQRVVDARPASVKKVLPALIKLKDESREDFVKLKSSIIFNTAGLSDHAHGVLGRAKLLSSGNIVEPAEELMAMAFDPDTHELRIEMPK